MTRTLPSLATLIVSHSHGKSAGVDPASATVYALPLNLILGPPNTSETGPHEESGLPHKRGSLMIHWWRGVQ